MLIKICFCNVVKQTRPMNNIPQFLGGIIFYEEKKIIGYKVTAMKRKYPFSWHKFLQIKACLKCLKKISFKLF